MVNRRAGDPPRGRLHRTDGGGGDGGGGGGVVSRGTGYILLCNICDTFFPSSCYVVDIDSFYRIYS